MKKVGMLVALVLLAAASFAQDGTVVVYRQSKYVGSALKPSVYIDGNQATRLGNGRYVSLQVAAGKHDFESSMKKEAPLEVEVKPNTTVYLEMIIMAGNWRGGGRLIPVGEEEGNAAVLRLKPADGQQAIVATTQSAQPETQAADNTQAEPQTEAAAPAQPATVTVKSTPLGADINVDGKFMGNTPSTIPLTPGDHMISVEKDGLRPWQRQMTVSAGGNINVDATLEKP
jgi:hypothetical protein